MSRWELSRHSLLGSSLTPPSVSTGAGASPTKAPEAGGAAGAPEGGAAGGGESGAAEGAAAGGAEGGAGAGASAPPEKEEGEMEAGGEEANDAQATSLKCDDCGKLFRSAEFAEMHAMKVNVVVYRAGLLEEA